MTVLPAARRHRRWPAIALSLLVLAAILALAWWAYHPGLSGDFLFDDFANLPVLGATGPIDNWAAFWRYITSGTADPTGRPLTLLTFLIDARNWPAHPYPFKVTNLALELLNGALLAWVLWRLGKVLAWRDSGRAPGGRAEAVPTAGAGLSEAKPLLVSGDHENPASAPLLVGAGLREAKLFLVPGDPSASADRAKEAVARGARSYEEQASGAHLVGAGLSEAKPFLVSGDRSPAHSRRTTNASVPLRPVAREARSYEKQDSAPPTLPARAGLSEAKPFLVPGDHENPASAPLLAGAGLSEAKPILVSGDQDHGRSVDGDGEVKAVAEPGRARGALLRRSPRRTLLAGAGLSEAKPFLVSGDRSRAPVRRTTNASVPLRTVAREARSYEAPAPCALLAGASPAGELSPLPPGGGARRAGEGSANTEGRASYETSASHEGVPSPLPLSGGERGSEPFPSASSPPHYARGASSRIFRRERGSEPFPSAPSPSHYARGASSRIFRRERGSEPSPCAPSPSRYARGVSSRIFRRERGSALLPSLRWTSQPSTSGDGRDASWPAIAALFGAGAWLLHPLFVSTTLYIVQREAMLPATFVLIGMLGWMASRDALARGHVRRALAGFAASAWLCTVLAVLSKANGALLPLLLLLVEWIVLARRPMPDAATRRWLKRAVAVFLIVPAVLVVAYLVSMLPGAIRSAPMTRGWTTGERLLTEARVLTDYLRLLFIPHAHSSGLFNDAFPVSTGWLHPATTLPCVILIAALIAAGFALRRRHPAIALALLFYFAAQLMESGWIPLELYFEHRSYVPAMLLFWPIGIGLARPGLLRGVRIACAAGLLLALAMLTSQRATLWGDGFRQAQIWAAINPDSARAQSNAALYDLAHDRPRLAAARLTLSLAKHPDDVQAPVNLISAECRLGGVRPATLAAADDALARTRVGGQVAFKWFGEALAIARDHACPGLDYPALQSALDAGRRNPHWQDVYGRRQDLDHMQGQLDLAEGHPRQALAAFNRALATAPNPDTALEQAAYLGATGHPQLGLAHLDYFATLPPGPKPRLGMPRIHAWVLRQQGWWPKETAYLRRNLAEDATRRARHASN